MKTLATMVEATPPPKATKTKMNMGWGINPVSKQAKSSKAMQRKQQRIAGENKPHNQVYNEMNFDDLGSEFTNYPPLSQQAYGEAPPYRGAGVQSSEAIRLNNK